MCSTRSGPTNAPVHAILVVRVKGSLTSADIESGLAARIGPHQSSAGLDAKELSHRWAGEVLFGSNRPSFLVLCVRNTADEIQFHIEPGGDSLGTACDTVWRAVAASDRSWKPKLTDARVEDPAFKAIASGSPHSRWRNVSAAEVSAILALGAGIGFIASGSANLVSQVPVLISGAVAVAAASIRGSRTGVDWKMS